MPTPTCSPESNSTRNDTIESPTTEGLTEATIDRLQDPRMRFRTMISLISLLRWVLHIKTDEHRRLVFPRISPRVMPSRRQQIHLRILGALATVLVRNDETTAVAGSLERVFVAYNPATPSDPAHTHTPRPGDLSLDAVMSYLTAARAGQTFDEHAKFIMQFVDQLRSGGPPGAAAGGLMQNLMTYVVGSSAPKMFHRLNHPKYSLPYFDAIIQLPTSDVRWIGGRASPPNRANPFFIDILHGLHGVRFLQGLQRDIMQPSTDPHWMRLIAELPKCKAKDPDGYKLLFPNLWRLTPESKAIYTKNTYCEFHRLLCLSLMGYRMTLGTLVGLSDPTQEDLLAAINDVCRYLMILRAISYTAAVVDHLSMVADADRTRRDRGASHKLREMEEREERREYTPGAKFLEDSADMDVADFDGPPTPLDTPHARWLRLQVAYLTAVGNIIDLSHLGPRLPDPIELIISTTTPSNEFMAPLMPVIESVVNHYLPGLRRTGPNGKGVDVVKTALEDLRECAGPSVGRTLDLMCQGSGFRGQVHCEMALAALMFDPPSGFLTHDRITIGASGRCCPVCSAVLKVLSPDQPINAIGHRTAVPCALPDNLSLPIVEFISSGFEWELSRLLCDLYVLSQRSKGAPNLRPLGLRALIRGEWSQDPVA